jgi:hypothetical protein
MIRLILPILYPLHPLIRKPGTQEKFIFAYKTMPNPVSKN